MIFIFLQLFFFYQFFSDFRFHLPPPCCHPYRSLPRRRDPGTRLRRLQNRSRNRDRLLLPPTSTLPSGKSHPILRNLTRTSRSHVGRTNGWWKVHGAQHFNKSFVFTVWFYQKGQIQGRKDRIWGEEFVILGDFGVIFGHFM